MYQVKHCKRKPACFSLLCDNLLVWFKPVVQTISIWRPKASPGWFSVGDVASRGLLPPPGAVVARADATGCLVSKPAKFRVVHQDKATGFVVWRPVARQGQVHWWNGRAATNPRIYTLVIGSSGGLNVSPSNRVDFHGTPRVSPFPVREYWRAFFSLW